MYHDLSYIMHEEYKTQTYYGPFEEGEIEERMNDEYATGLALFGRLSAVSMSEEDLTIFYVYPAEFWYEQLDRIQETDPYGLEVQDIKNIIFSLLPNRAEQI